MVWVFSSGCDHPRIILREVLTPAGAQVPAAAANTAAGNSNLAAVATALAAVATALAEALVLPAAAQTMR